MQKGMISIRSPVEYCSHVWSGLHSKMVPGGATSGVDLVGIRRRILGRKDPMSCYLTQ